MDHASAIEDAADEAPLRKSWYKPEVKLLPVEQTQTSTTIGNDGNGTFTGS